MASRPAQKVSSIQRDRHDYGALEQRVYGAERKIDDLSAQTSQQIQDLRRDLSTQISGLGSDFKAQQTANFESGKTRWTPIVGTGATVVAAFVAIFGVVGSMALGPIRTDIEKLYVASEKINERMTPLLTLADDQKANVTRFAALEKSEDAKWSKDAQTEYEHRADQVVALEHEYDQRDFDRLLGRVNTMDGELIKRPEIEAIDNGLRNQINTVGQSLEDFRKEMGSAYTLGDEVKSLRSQIESLSGRLFTSLATPALAPIAPIAPLAPVSPSR